MVGNAKMDGKTEQLEGRAQKAFGDLTDNQEQQDKGQARQNRGKVKEAKGKAQDKLEDAKDAVTGS